MSSQLNMDIGDEYKKKLKEIAENQKRDMTNQVRVWIDEKYEEVISSD